MGGARAREGRVIGPPPEFDRHRLLLEQPESEAANVGADPPATMPVLKRSYVKGDETRECQLSHPPACGDVESRS